MTVNNKESTENQLMNLFDKRASLLTFGVWLLVLIPSLSVISVGAAMYFQYTPNESVVVLIKTLLPIAAGVPLVLIMVWAILLSKDILQSDLLKKKRSSGVPVTN
jgi:hypothetical protein